MSRLLEVEQLTLEMGGKRVCQQLEWQVQQGEVWGVLGVNGVGKSTLLQALCGLRSVASGTIQVMGRPLQTMKRREIARWVGLLFQHQDDLFPSTVLEQVMMGRHPHTTLLQREQPEDIEIAQNCIERVGLQGMEQRILDTLSGGERRRAAIATLLAQQPQLYLLDEPEAHLDPSHQKAIFREVVMQVQSQPAGLVMALHDINLAIHHCTHLLLLMGDGVVEQGCTADMVTPQRVERLYGTAMTHIQQEGQSAYLPL